MPIDYKQYHQHWWLISWMIRFKRANNKCEHCNVPNYSFINRDKQGNWHFRFSLKAVNELLKWKWSVREICKEFDCTYIVLTVAHIDRDKNNNHFSNLAALCQKCHLHHDKHQHVNNRKYGRNHKLNQTALDI